MNRAFDELTSGSMPLYFVHTNRLSALRLSFMEENPAFFSFSPANVYANERES